MNSGVGKAAKDPSVVSFISRETQLEVTFEGAFKLARSVVMQLNAAFEGCSL